MLSYLVYKCEFGLTGYTYVAHTYVINTLAKFFVANPSFK